MDIIVLVSCSSYIEGTYIYINVSSDINECLTDNGDCEHTCTNTEGNFSCSCNIGYDLDSNRFNCSGEICMWLKTKYLLYHF